MDQNKLNQQSNYWETNFLAKPEMFGSMPSKAALSALKKLKEENVEEIVELGAGLGRDTIHFAENKIKVEALDYSSAAIKIIDKKIKEKNLSSLVTTKFFDVRHKLPYKDNSIKGFYSHMLYCMALTNSNIEKLNNEILRVLKPRGCVYILEFSKPKNFPIKQLFGFYSKAILPLLGSFISKDKSAYHYLPASVDAFPEGKNFIIELYDAGFSNSTYKSLSGGISSIYVAEKS